MLKYILIIYLNQLRCIWKIGSLPVHLCQQKYQGQKNQGRSLHFGHVMNSVAVLNCESVILYQIDIIKRFHSV